MPIESDFDIRQYVQKAELEDGTRMFDITAQNPFDFEFRDNDEVRRVDQRDLRRLDRIANEKYNEPQFWWIVLYVANTFFHPEDLEVGDELELPSGNDIFDFLERNRDA